MPDAAPLRLLSLHRYPVKGLSPEPLERAELVAGGHFPGDRLYAVENGPSGFDGAAPRHQPKVKYLMLMRDADLARLRTRYDDATATLTVEGAGEEAGEGAGEPLRARLDTEAGRAALADLLGRFVPGALRGPPRVLAAPAGYRFTDSPLGHVSLINRASVAALEDYVGAPVDPLRFRGNLLVEGLPAFAELDLVGRVIAGPGGVRLRVVKRTERCAATDVDPVSGVRDLKIPWTLDARLGHRDLGVYAEVVAGGSLAVGDQLRVEG